MEVHLTDTQDISNAQVTYRRRERRIFIIYGSFISIMDTH